MIVLNGLLSLKDMGGRRRQVDRRKLSTTSYHPERRKKDRRSGFDRRGILECSIQKNDERRAAFRDLFTEEPH